MHHTLPHNSDSLEEDSDQPPALFTVQMSVPFSTLALLRRLWNGPHNRPRGPYYAFDLRAEIAAPRPPITNGEFYRHGFYQSMIGLSFGICMGWDPREKLDERAKIKTTRQAPQIPSPSTT